MRFKYWYCKLLFYICLSEVMSQEIVTTHIQELTSAPRAVVARKAYLSTTRLFMQCQNTTINMDWSNHSLNEVSSDNFTSCPKVKQITLNLNRLLTLPMNVFEAIESEKSSDIQLLLFTVKTRYLIAFDSLTFVLDKEKHP